MHVADIELATKLASYKPEKGFHKRESKLSK